MEISLVLLQHLSDAPEGQDRRLQIAEALQRDTASVTTAALILRRRKLITTNEGLYQITDAGRAFLAEGRSFASRPGPRAGTRTRGLRARAWWVIRELRKFTIPDLLDRIADSSHKSPQSNLQRYIQHLERAGVLKRMARRVPGAVRGSKGHVVYWLALDVGRQPPVARQDGRVFDPNHSAYLEPPQPTEHTEGRRDA